MKKLQCELCGGRDIVKEGAFFVCQDCGCKYSIEAAKEMIKSDPTQDDKRPGMDERDIVKLIMKAKGWSQAKLAEEAGFKSQSNITGYLNRYNSMQVSNLFVMLDAMGCELVIRDKSDPEKEWIIKK